MKAIDFLKDWDPKNKKVLLYSGGSDSYMIDFLWKPDVKLYINIHGRYSEEEISRLPDDVIIEDFPYLGHLERPDAIIPLRNLYFVMIASQFGDEIGIGATAGDRVLDKSPRFAEDTSNLLSYLYSPQHWIPSGRKVKVSLDFKDYTKKQILKMYLENGGNLVEAATQSFSCYDPINGHECFACKPCFRKAVAFMINGYQYNQEQEMILKNYIASEIMPDIEAGIYGRGQEEEDDITTIYNYLCEKYEGKR
jgi:7-cyano-7-deazaguanine synthase in queuosine biosynthesis